MASINYKAAGVDIEAGNEAVSRIKYAVESTFSPHVLTNVGCFGAMYDIKHLIQNYTHPVLVQSIDGVGTKMMVANMMQKFDTIGIDLVSATANDIIVMGATPLTLLDYIASATLQPDIIEQIVKGIACACLDNGIALIGGETAEMPGTYLSGESDLVGIVTGVVEKDQAIQGCDIVAGDVVAAFPSSGLHTNGYSLARKLLFDVAGFHVNSYCNDLSHTIGEELLIPHINYTKPILGLLKQNIPIKGMAHITGGGLLDNIPRILPKHCSIEIEKHNIPTPAIFSLLRELGNLDDKEMYKTFNMGVGLVLVCSREALSLIQAALLNYPNFPLYEIGRVVTGHQELILL